MVIVVLMMDYMNLLSCYIIMCQTLLDWLLPLFILKNSRELLIVLVKLIPLELGKKWVYINCLLIFWNLTVLHCKQFYDEFCEVFGLINVRRNLLQEFSIKTNFFIMDFNLHVWYIKKLLVFYFIVLLVQASIKDNLHIFISTFISKSTQVIKHSLNFSCKWLILINWYFGNVACSFVFYIFKKNYIVIISWLLLLTQVNTLVCHQKKA